MCIQSLIDDLNNICKNIPEYISKCTYILNIDDDLVKLLCLIEWLGYGERYYDESMLKISNNLESVQKSIDLILHFLDEDIVIDGVDDANISVGKRSLHYILYLIDYLTDSQRMYLKLKYPEKNIT